MNNSVKLWSALSVSDLKSSQLLYNNGHFRTSYFFFQQATEKANKAFALYTGQFNEREFKDIQHDQLKIYKKIIVKKEDEINLLLKELEPFPDETNHKLFSKTFFSKYHKSLIEGIIFIDSLKGYDLVKIPISDLNYLLNQIKKLKATKIILPRNYDNEFKKQMLGVADWLSSFGTLESLKTKTEIINLINNKDQTEQFKKCITNHLIPMIIDYSYINLILYFCAIITIQHSSLSRYPIEDVNPDSIYVKQLPIVKKQNDFMNLLMEAINKLNKLNNN